MAVNMTFQNTPPDNYRVGEVIESHNTNNIILQNPTWNDDRVIEFHNNTPLAPGIIGKSATVGLTKLQPFTPGDNDTTVIVIGDNEEMPD